MAVRRLLPTRGRRLVGPWCFLDHYGPTTIQGRGMGLGAHPHLGLQTVSWLLRGEILHRDSLGSEQIIQPGQLNLMTSGGGIAHSEETPARHGPEVHGVQLWVALPETARHGEPAFEHHGTLPEIGIGPFKATVFLGAFGGVRSGAISHSPILGAEWAALKDGEAEVSLNPAFEHAVVLLEGRAALEGEPLEIGSVYPVPSGRDGFKLRAERGARILLLGGGPFPEPILMWWNFVARTPEEMTVARTAWERGDFPKVAGNLPRVPAPTLDPSSLRLRR
ncbi:MAG: pirin family protein [Acidobacteria bacterium]|nr:pirin family protein [Acidobacteriota bacterium]